MPKSLPESLRDHILPFDWDVKKVWALKAATALLPRRDLDHLLHLPLWSSVPGRGMLFDISPLDVLADPERSPHQSRRVQEANIHIPIDLLHYQGRTWILDGVHRLARCHQLGIEVIEARCHPENVINEIMIPDKYSPAV